MPKQPLMLMILDGWGINPQRENNAIAQARTPNMDRLCAEYPCTEMGTSGMSVGLPEGQMGNSEVGHLNIGAGRIVYQDLTRISKSIEDGDFFTNPVLLDCIAKTKAAGGRLHLAGLLSDGGVHSHNTHLYALLRLAKQQGLDEVFIHCLLDGRDTPPQSGQITWLSWRRKSQGSVAAVSPRLSAAFMPWIGITVGNGWKRPTGPLSAAMVRYSPRLQQPSTRVMKTASPTNLSFLPLLLRGVLPLAKSTMAMVYLLQLPFGPCPGDYPQPDRHRLRRFPAPLLGKSRLLCLHDHL